MADALDETLQYAYEKELTGARSVVYNVVQQMFFDLLRGDVMDGLLDKHIAEYLDISDKLTRSGKS